MFSPPGSAFRADLAGFLAVCTCLRRDWIAPQEFKIPLRELLGIKWNLDDRDRWLLTRPAGRVYLSARED